MTDPQLARTFDLRLARYGDDLRRGLAVCFGDRAEETFERVLRIVAAAMADRSPALRDLDEQRLLAPDWLQDPRMIAYVAYADRFGGDLQGVRRHLDHLDSLDVTHLHLMPLLDPRPGDSDGGYAVRDYRRVREDLGTMEDLAVLASDLHILGMSLELDLVLNHVAREHDWAVRARAGEQRYRDYFLTYPDRTMPDRWEATLPEVFPDFAPGNFTWDEELEAWVWTTFNAFQWDLDWSNPDVFCEFLEIICYLANQGVDVLRLDAIAFTWKRLGTNCQNQPEVHHLTRALRAAARIAAPALAFKAEAIVGPQDLITYLGVGEHHGKVSDTAYHNSFMVQLWSALASRDTRLLRTALTKFPPKPTSTTWSTYIRCHDDIGWAIADEDAADAGLDGFAHRAFLSEFYSGTFPGSFADGLVFQHNPATGDKRISGSLAALAGLTRALEAHDGTGDTGQVRLAIDRILLLHAAMLGFGGMPLLYMGDEIALGNDHDFAADPAHAADNRWAHRPAMPWDQVAAAEADIADDGGPRTPAGEVLSGLRHLIAVRQGTAQLHASIESAVLESPDRRLLILLREHPLAPMMQVYNMSEHVVQLDPGILSAHVGTQVREAIGGHDWDLAVPMIDVRPYQALWFLGAGPAEL
ncbi:MAG: alpha-amylase family protein [Brachybacterium sp.]|nr:alpha-amylase family protein [Brachybacterium sp.]